MEHVQDDVRAGAPSRHLVIASLLYLGVASALMIWRGISVSPDYLLLLLIPVAIASGRLFRFLGDWIPFIAIFLGWEAMRGVAAESDIAPHVSDLAHAETWLFGGHLPSAELQSAMAWLGIGRAVDYLGTIVYFGHFVIPVAVGMTLWFRSRAHFLRFSTALMGMSFAAFIIFLLVPTAPPWYAQDEGVLSGFRHVIGSTLPSAVSPYYSSLNPNPTAAFPSLHSAFPFLSFLLLRRVYPRAAYVALAWSVLVWFSVVYLGEHYVIDVAGGITLALASAWVLEKVVVPRVPALQDAPTRSAAARPARPTPVPLPVAASVELVAQKSAARPAVAGVARRAR